MEEKNVNAGRKFRGRVAILQLLQEQTQSGQSIRSFCVAHGLAEGTFHNWKRKYGSAPVVGEPAGFSALEITPQPGLIAVVRDIKIYQPVSAAYLKELLS